MTVRAAPGTPTGPFRSTESLDFRSSTPHVSAIVNPLSDVDSVGRRSRRINPFVVTSRRGGVQKRQTPRFRGVCFDRAARAAVRTQSSTRSRSVLPGLKNAYLRAGIVILLPVAGFVPWRALP